MHTLFSILLPTYKKRYLKECIDSVLLQSYPYWELIIVNDASPEDIDAIVHAYSDPRIRYYTNAQNFGAKRLVEQWNYCLSLAKGEYVLCIGDDDKLSANCLETYAKLIEQYPQVRIFHGQTDIIDEQSRLVRHTPSRPQWESAMSMLYHRIIDRHPQFIGDFCYHTESLRAQGGYYYLPYAWGSDDISALQAASDKGIANTQEVVFLYRSNEMSITRQKLLFPKWKAVLLEAAWKRRFLRQHQSNPQDEAYRKQLQKGLVKHTLKKMYYIWLNTKHA